MIRIKTQSVTRDGKKYRLRCPICGGTSFYSVGGGLLFCPGCTETLGKIKYLKSRHQKSEK
jgi:hypothetical protein